MFLDFYYTVRNFRGPAHIGKANMCTPTEDAANMCTPPTEASSSASLDAESVHGKKKCRIATAPHVDFALNGASFSLFSHAHVESLSVQQLKDLIKCPETQNLVGCLLSKIESCLIESCDGDFTMINNIDHLLQRISSSYRSSRKKMSDDAQKVIGPRYPVAIFLQALVVLKQTQSIVSDNGGGIVEQEAALKEAAMKLISQFHGLASNILAYCPQRAINGSLSNNCSASSTTENQNCVASKGPMTIKNSSATTTLSMQMSMMNGKSNLRLPTSTGMVPMSLIDFEGNVTSAPTTTGVPLMSTIYSGRNVFATELAEFDATWCSYLNHLVQVEEHLIRIACRIESLMLQKCHESIRFSNTNNDVEATSARDECFQKKTVLRKRIFDLTGVDGVLKIDSALALTYNRFQASLRSKNGCDHATVGFKLKDGGAAVPEAADRKMLFKLKQVQTQRSPERPLDTEKLINDLLHGNVPNVINSSSEKQIWNSVYEDVKKVPPSYERIIKKFNDIKTELLSLIQNDNSKQDVEGCMDVEIFSQFLNSGTDDTTYFRDLLGFVLQLILDLEVPERDDETMREFTQLITRLDTQIPFGEAAVIGIRFVHERVMVVKSDATMVKLQEHINRGGGIKHLQIGFAKRFGNGKLPKTAKWLQSLKDNQHIQQIRLELETLRSPSNRGLKQFPITMKTGKRGHQKFGHLSRAHVYGERRTLDWSSVRVQVGFGILDLVTRMGSMSDDKTPETMCLNVHRLTKARCEFVYIVSKATSLLVLSQVAASKGILGTDLDDLLSKGKHLLDNILRGSVTKVGALFAEMCGMESDIEFITGVLTRNLNSKSVVFTRVSAGIALSLSAIVLLGKGNEGMDIAVSALHRVGASCLLESVLKLGTKVNRLIFVTNSVHGAWYNACNAQSQA